MAYLIGGGLALAIGVMATLVGLDRDRAFYPTVVLVVASYYALFAVLGGSSHALVVESVFIAAFVAAALAGFKYSPWIVAAALAGHGVFDAFHARLIANPGVPEWWPRFCGTYDVVAAAGLALLIRRRRTEVGSATITGT